MTFFFFPTKFLSFFLHHFYRRRYHVAPVDGGPRPLKVVIRRSRLLEDALATLVPAGGALRGPLRIEFIDAQGMLVGIDSNPNPSLLLYAIKQFIVIPTCFYILFLYNFS